ncbi:MAG: hypothetical protein HY606_12880 [Planctomycetes bacterium]|nr:hypothetical protein [Planctomycetota bacterium]
MMKKVIAMSFGLVLGMSTLLFGAQTEKSPLSPVEKKVGVYSTSQFYLSGYLDVLKEMGVEIVSLKVSDLQSPEILGQFKVLFLNFVYTDKEYYFPQDIQDNIAKYVKSGGRLFSDYRTLPPMEVVGYTGHGEGSVKEIEIVDTNNFITNDFSKGQKLKYEAYGRGLQASSSAVQLANTILLNKYGEGYCIYSGVLLSIVKDENAFERKRLISNIFAYLLGMEKLKMVRVKEDF